MFYLALSFVCYQLQVKTTDWIFMKILPEMYLWTRKSSLNFGSHLSDVDQGNFWIFFFRFVGRGNSAYYADNSLSTNSCEIFEGCDVLHAINQVVCCLRHILLLFVLIWIQEFCNGIFTIAQSGEFLDFWMQLYKYWLQCLGHELMQFVCVAMIIIHVPCTCTWYMYHVHGCGLVL